MLPCNDVLDMEGNEWRSPLAGCGSTRNGFLLAVEPLASLRHPWLADMFGEKALCLRLQDTYHIDGFHKGTGHATIYLGQDGTRLLRFEDFKVTNGPELHVVLSPYGGPEEKGGRLKSPGWIDLGKLKGNIGNQNYLIPDDVDIGIHNSVTIWCKPFNVIFSVAVFGSAS